MDAITINLGILLAVALGGLFMFWRNNAVYTYRMKVITEISKLNHAAIDRHDYTYDWRWGEFDSVSYQAMWLQPWRSLSSFYRAGFPAVEAQP